MKNTEDNRRDTQGPAEKRNNFRKKGNHPGGGQESREGGKRIVYRLDQLALPLTDDKDPASIRARLSEKLHLRQDEICDLTLLRRSLDARKRQEAHYVVSVSFSFADSVREEIIRKLLKKQELRPYEVSEYPYPARKTGKSRPVIVGTGPAGLFCGYFLAMAGLNPILLERGKPVEERSGIVNAFWNGEKLDPDCNVQFGEGGAGTFSDGKLNSSVLGKAPAGNEVLKIFVKYGADEEIRYSNKPHIGTDQLKKVILAMRKDMEAMGAEFRFSTRFEGPLLKKEKLCGIRICRNGVTEELPAETLILCIGHSARDTFERLYEAGIRMEQKPFAVGLRIQHPQRIIDEAQYGAELVKRAGAYLPVSDYKLTTTVSSGRGVYSFCMCPGGYVVNASSEEGHLAVNGMSDHDRDSGVANSAIVAAVDGRCFGNGLFDGMRFQRRIEETAFRLGGGAIPVECVGDYLLADDDPGLFEAEKARRSDPASIRIKGAYRYAALHTLFPKEIYLDLCEGIRTFGGRIRGFDKEDALLAGVESRTSSPIRILRDESGQCNVHGIYPCGEGAGYAGGITSAAADGIKIAEKIISL